MRQASAGEAVPGWRALTLLTAACFAVVGAALFVAPGWAADHFAFRVSEFQAMTMGGWFLGSAAMALLAARAAFVDAVPTLVHLWAFSLFEAFLLVWHSDDVDLGSVLAVGYAVALAIGCAGAVWGVIGLVRSGVRGDVAGGGPNPWYSRVASAMFVIYVGGIVLLLVDGIEPNGKIWPGPLTLLAARAFAGFFGALVLAEAVLVFARRFGPVDVFLRGGVILILPITAAALVYLDRFDYGEHPGGALYLGSYVAALIGALSILFLAHRGVASREPGEAGAVRLTS
jgi:hypothetical protein